MQNTRPQVGVSPLPATDNTDRARKVNRLRGVPCSGYPRLVRWIPRTLRQAIIKSLRRAIEHLEQNAAPEQQQSASTALNPTRSSWEQMWRCVQTGESWQDAMDRGTEEQGTHHVE